MNTKPLTFLLSLLAIAFLITGFLTGDAYGLSIEEANKKMEQLSKSMRASQKKHYFSNEPINPRQKKLFEERLKLAEQGDAEAQSLVGLALYNGWGTSRNCQKRGEERSRI